MKPFTGIILAIALAASLGSGQRLETTIQLPDSFGDVRFPNLVAYVPTHNTLYVGSGSASAMLVLDCATGQKVGRVPVPGGVVASLYNALEDKLYVSCQRSRVYVIDAAANQVIDSITTPPDQRLMALNRVRNRLYTADKYEGTISVIDCAADSLARQVAVGASLTALCCDTSGGRLFCGDVDAQGVLVYDCALDSVVKTIRIGAGPFGLLFNCVNNRLYCSDQASANVALIEWCETQS